MAIVAFVIAAVVASFAAFVYAEFARAIAHTTGATITVVQVVDPDDRKGHELAEVSLDETG